MPIDPYAKRRSASSSATSVPAPKVSTPPPNLKGQITLAQVVTASRWYYRNIDNKERRANRDITSAKVKIVNNYTYDPSTRNWKQTGRNLKFMFEVSSTPKSYKAGPPKKRKYPVTFLIQDVALGMNSPFRWRTGSLKKPIFLAKNAPKYKNASAGQINIKNGIQMDFFFNLEWVLKSKGLLYGICWATKPPRKINPRNRIYFDKHAWFIMKKVLIPILLKKQSFFSRYIVNK
jgi:hypothetical protein